jgi:hypothetical protein
VQGNGEPTQGGAPISRNIFFTLDCEATTPQQIYSTTPKKGYVQKESNKKKGDYT